MENSLSTIVKKDQTNWPKLVDSCLFVYRTTYNRSLQEIPFFLLYGRDPTLPQDLLVPHPKLAHRQITASDLDTYKDTLIKTLRSTYDKLQRTKEDNMLKYKEYYDKTHKIVNFEPGDLVLVHTQVPEAGLSLKLGRRWKGPYKIESKIDNVTYRVREDEVTRSRSTPIHVQRLKRYKPYTVT